MESSALFVLADALGVRCGACNHVIWNQEREIEFKDSSSDHDVNKAIDTCVEALRILIEEDKSNE